MEGEGNKKEDNQWGVISSLYKIQIYYENDLGRDNDVIKAYIWEIEKSTQYKKVDLLQTIKKTKEFWRELITESIEELLETIESKKGRGGEFAEEKIELEKLKEEITFAELDLETYEAIYEEGLKDKREIIKEKVLNLAIKSKKSWKFLLIGACIGSFLGLIIKFFIDILT